MAVLGRHGTRTPYVLCKCRLDQARGFIKIIFQGFITKYRQSCSFNSFSDFLRNFSRDYFSKSSKIGFQPFKPFLSWKSWVNLNTTGGLSFRIALKLPSVNQILKNCLRTNTGCLQELLSKFTYKSSKDSFKNQHRESLTKKNCLRVSFRYANKIFSIISRRIRSRAFS